MQVKGAAVETIPKFVKSKFGDEGYRKWLDSLPAETRKQFEFMILSSKWYPLKEMLVEPTIKICDLFYQGNINGAVEQGRFSAEHGLVGIYKVFIKLGSPGFIIDRASTIMSSYYENSAIEVMEKGDKRIRLHITKFDEPSKVVENRIKGWIERALEMSSAKNPKLVIFKSMADGADVTEFIVTWE